MYESMRSQKNPESMSSPDLFIRHHSKTAHGVSNLMLVFGWAGSSKKPSSEATGINKPN